MTERPLVVFLTVPITTGLRPSMWDPSPPACVFVDELPTQRRLIIHQLTFMTPFPTLNMFGVLSANRDGVLALKPAVAMPWLDLAQNTLVFLRRNSGHSCSN